MRRQGPISGWRNAALYLADYDEDDQINTTVCPDVHRLQVLY